jgi:sugar/nucleoside kinase (ribokinase family)
MHVKKPVVCLGILVADVVGRSVKSIPAPGRLVLIDEMGLYTGGCALNTGSALSRLGVPVEIIGPVGTDPFGNFLLDEMGRRKLGLKGVKRIPDVGTSATMVMVEPGGERRFIHYIGANACLTRLDVDLELIRNASILHVAGSLVMPGIDGEPTAEILRFARHAGVITCLDTAWDDTGRWLAVLKPCLSHLDYFIPSLAEAQALTGLDDPLEMAQVFLNYGIGTIGIKMGERGCLVATRQGDVFRLPAFQVNSVDATGAGDAFAAGFIAGVWFGWSIDRSARLANAVGALCVTEMGAMGGIHNLPETLEFMEKTITGET